jgi:two-component system, chemotaxis family, protein-glutamate methylesterase/glutaminase
VAVENELVTRDVICVGASSGGVTALTKLVAQLPHGLPAAVLVVLHTAPSSPGALPNILARASSWPAKTAVHGEPLAHGRIWVAPPDHHLLVVDGQMVLDRGPPENRVRPAVDTLFRSAAAWCGARCIGVVLTGHLSDGSAGARAIKRTGGVVIAQSPDDAESPSMPRATIELAAPDHVVPLAEMGEVLARVVGTRAPFVPMPDDLAAEVAHGIRFGEGSIEVNDRIGRRAPFICPDCGGPLWHLMDGLRFRCLLGHAYNGDVLERAKAHSSMQALWVAARTLDERARLLTEMAKSQRNSDRTLTADLYEARAVEVRAAADEIRRMIAAVPSPMAEGQP